MNVANKYGSYTEVINNERKFIKSFYKKDKEQINERVIGYEDELSSEDLTKSLQIMKWIAQDYADEKCDRDIARGISYDSHTFSMSMQAQQNWSTVLSALNDLTFPLAVTAREGEYVFNDAVTYKTFALTAIGTIKAHVDTTRANKETAENTITNINEAITFIQSLNS